MNNNTSIELNLKKSTKNIYHYEYDIDECVLCGRGHTTKLRVNGPRPEDKSLIYHYSQYACSEHFI